MSCSSMMMSPRLMPIRNSMRRSLRTPSLRNAMPRCSSTAQRTASTTLANSAKSPSPVVLTMRPRCSPILRSDTSRRSAVKCRVRALPRPPPSAANSPRHRQSGPPPAAARCALARSSWRRCYRDSAVYHSTGEAGLLLEHLTQGGEGESESVARHSPEAAHEALLVERSHLIQQYEAVFAAEPERYAIGRRTAAGGHRRDCDGAQKVMHLRRGDDDKGSGLLYFRTACRIERREPDFPTTDGHDGRRRSPASRRAKRPHQIRVSSSALANSGQTSESSRSSAMACEASDQPARARRFIGTRTIRPASSVISTGSPSPTPSSRSNDFGMMTPDELPNLRTAARITPSSRITLL